MTQKKTKTIVVEGKTVTNLDDLNVTAPSANLENVSTTVEPEKKTSVVRLNQNTGTVDLSQYTPAELESYRKHAVELKSNDNTSILNFGVETQNKLARSSDVFLSNVRQFDAGEIGSSINDLLTELNYIEVDKLEQNGLQRFLMNIPILKKLVMNTKKIFEKYDTVGNNVEKIATKLDKGRIVIMKDNVMLDELFNKNVEFIGDLENKMMGGHVILQELETELADMEVNSGNYEDYEIADKRDFVDRLRKRLHDMALTRMITIQSLPQIRLVQNNNNTMVEKIQSSIVTTIPIWKNTLALAVTIKRQEEIAKVNDKIYNATNKMLEENAKKLKSNSVSIAKQNERGVVDIEALKKVQQNLLETLAEVKQIKAEGENNRRMIAKELDSLEKGLESEILQLK